ncbi:MAG: polysaccharide biosynthesis/export family protein [Acidobacteria bacterium]|nr:polysaccharide biosynthesis/export family protein [Acidobacteriota bacterium]
MNFTRSTFFTILALIGISMHASPISAQQRRGEPQQDRPASQSSTSEPGNAIVLAEPDKDYRISPGDVIQIQVEDAPELSHYYRVNSSGLIEMPAPVGPVEARGKTTAELSRLIAERLRKEEYLNAPNVRVTINQYYSQTFFIQGSVQKPGIYQVEGHPSLLTMIGLAGGLTDTHGSTVFILRPSKTRKPGAENQSSDLQVQASGPSQTAQPKTGDSDSAPAADYELLKVNLGGLYKGQFGQNLRLEPGDIINVPRADVFFVAGEVKAPGSFPLKEGTTLRQAVSLAQGMTFSAKSSKGVIFREDPLLGSRREIKVDIGAVMNGKREDILVQANDVIIVPNSRTKSIGGVLLTAFGVNSARYPMRY